jgi:hypothetical protein
MTGTHTARFDTQAQMAGDSSASPQARNPDGDKKLFRRVVFITKPLAQPTESA